MKKKMLEKCSIFIAALIAVSAGPAQLAAAAEITDLDTQLVLFSEDLSAKLTSVDPTEPYYFVTDLDHDGFLEIQAQIIAGASAIYYETLIYEVNDTMDGLNMVADFGSADSEIAPDGYYDLETSTNGLMGSPEGTLTGYYDPTNDIYYYVMYDDVRNGMTSHTSTYYLVHLEDQMVYQKLGEDNMDGSGETWTLADGSQVSSQEAFFAAFKQNFEGFTPFTYTIQEFSYNSDGAYEDNVKASAEAWINGTDLGGASDTGSDSTEN